MDGQPPSHPHGLQSRRRIRNRPVLRLRTAKQIPNCWPVSASTLRVGRPRLSSRSQAVMFLDLVRKRAHVRTGLRPEHQQRRTKGKVASAMKVVSRSYNIR